jgi:hypothetical protein
MLLSKNDVPALHRLLTVAIRRGASINAILQQVQKAAEGVYSPRGNWSQRELDIAFLAKAMGGPRLLYALQKAIGLPSVSSVQRHRQPPQLRPSLKQPTRDEMVANITALLGPGGKPAPKRNFAGQVLMIDDLAIEEQCRLDPSTKSVVGGCREHTGNTNLRVTDLASIVAIETALHIDKTMHYGKDGTVVAIGAIADSEHYAAVLSASCKKETGKELAGWLGLFLDVYREHEYGAKVHGPIMAIATDGAASFRTARFVLCMTEDLLPTSDIGKCLYQLSGMNCRTGRFGLVGTCDPKHVMKRFATLLRSPVGIMIHDTNITPQDTLENLVSLGMSLEKARESMNPADKQNVPKAVQLVQNLLKIETADCPVIPAAAHRHHRILFLAKVLSYFVAPFTNVNMSLCEQIRSLATYSHLAVAMYKKNALEFYKRSVC